jgi:hypothetical protein
MGFENFTKLIQETYPLTLSELMGKKLFLWVKRTLKNPTIEF